MARLALIVSMVLCATAGEARAYCLLDVQGTNPHVSWKSSPVTYRVSSNLTDAALLAAIDAAFATWGAVSCSTLAFSKGSPFTPCFQQPCATGAVAPTQNTGTINVFWYTGAAGFPTSTQYVAYTYVIHDGLGGLLGTSVAINAFNYTWNATGGSASPPILDLQNEMTGLVGGMIGLTDSNVVGSSMYPGSYYGDTSKRTLAQDDIDGLVYLYKVASCPAPPAPGASGCSALPPDAGVPDGPVAGDGGPADALVVDASSVDLSPVEAGAPDGPADLPGPDAGPLEAGFPDSAAADLGGDAGAADLGVPDAPRPADTGGTVADAGPGDGPATSDALPIAPVEEGCDCRVGRAPGPAGWLLLLLGLALLFRRR